MLTIFSVPKPFEGHVGTIQRNAIRSWTALEPACEVILCGDEPGTTRVARDFGAGTIPDVACNEFGTPLLDSVFGRVEKQASNDILCYANADLILYPDLLEAVRVAASAFASFLLVGATTNIDVRDELELGGLHALRARAAATGALRGDKWIDYFVFPRGALGPLPAFAVGRPKWDNWMIWRARSLRIPVVDASPSALVIHQEHEYGHVPQARGARWEGPEGDRNLRLLGPDERVYSLANATYLLSASGLVSRPQTIRRRLDNEVVMHEWALPFYRPIRRTYARVRRVLRL